VNNYVENTKYWSKKVFRLISVEKIKDIHKVINRLENRKNQEKYMFSTYQHKLLI